MVAVHAYPDTLTWLNARHEPQLGGNVKADVFRWKASPHALYVGDAAGIVVAPTENALWDDDERNVCLGEAVKVQSMETVNTGGGCMVDVILLEDGTAITVSDEAVAVYRGGMDGFWDDDGAGADAFTWLSAL